jgi:hypothetical protein
VAMPDRRNAPVFAAAAAFVLVLVFGKLLGSNSPIPNPNPSGSPTPTPTSSSSPSPKASSSGGHVGTIPTTPPALVQLTVEVTEQAGATSGVPQAIPVQVLSEKRHATPVIGTLFPEANGTNLQWTTSLAAGTYQVCVQPPTGTKFVGPNIDVKSGFSCTVVRLATGSPPVVFTLARAAG